MQFSKYIIPIGDDKLDMFLSLTCSRNEKEPVPSTAAAAWVFQEM